MLRRPQLHRGGGRDERHATWLELFFDLVFVVAVAELAKVLHHDLTPGGLAVFTALFVPIWWQWIDFSYYADQFETEDISSQIVTLLVMFGVIALALTIHKVPHGGSELFTMVYAALRAVIIVLYALAWRFVPESRELTARYTVSFIVALVVWCISLLVPEPLRFVFWGIALFIEISNGPITYATIKNVPAQVSHMDERFGLFVIIVLGEAVIAVATGVADTAWRWPALLTAVCGFLIATFAWWMYFVRADFSVIHQALRSNKRGLLLSYVYGYSHFFVFAGVTAAGVGIEAAIQAAPTSALSLGGRAALCGGAAMFLLGVGALQWAAPRSLPGRVLGLRIVGALLCLILTLAGSGVPPLALTALMAGVLAALIAFEAVSASRAQV